MLFRVPLDDHALFHTRIPHRVCGILETKIDLIQKDPELQDPKVNVTYPDYDRLSFWGVPYQFDHVFEPGTEQVKVSPRFV